MHNPTLDLDWGETFYNKKIIEQLAQYEYGVY